MRVSRNRGIVMKRIPWDQYFLSQALVLSMRSTCDRLMVGAVIVRDNRVIAGGYNGSVSGETHCSEGGCYLEDGHCVRTIHAEMNAIIQCAKFGVSTEGAEIYVTHFPCLPCTKQIIQAGIKKVSYLYDYHNHPYALELYQKTGVTVWKRQLEDDFFHQLHQQNLLNCEKEKQSKEKNSLS